jgi:hypothetical protein
VTRLGVCGNVDEILPPDPSALFTATNARIRCRSIQTDRKKTKQKGLDFLGFPWWKWDFSRGYEESKQKFRFRLG